MLFTGYGEKPRFHTISLLLTPPARDSDAWRQNDKVRCLE